MSLRAPQGRSNLIRIGKNVEIAALPLVARNDNLLYEIAALPLVARNDNLLYEIAALRSQ